MATWEKTTTPGKFRVRASVTVDGKRTRPFTQLIGTTRTIQRLADEWEAGLRDAAGAPEVNPGNSENASDEADDDPDHGPTFAEVARAYIDATAIPKGWSPEHLKSREVALHAIELSDLGAIPMSQLTRAHLGAHLTAYANTPTVHGKPRGAHSVNTRKVVLAAVVNFAMAEPNIHVAGNPAKGLGAKAPGKTVAERDIPTVADFDSLVIAATDAMEAAVVADLEGRRFNRGMGYRGRPGYRDRAEMVRDVARFALLSGMRRSEVLALRANEVDDLDDGSATVLVRHSLTDAGTLKKTKTEQHRRITVPPAAAAILRRRLGLNEVHALTDGVEPPRAPFVFSVGWGEAPLRPDAVTHWWEALRGHEPRLEGLRFQDLRHACATDLHASGAPVAAIAAYLGHSVEVSLFTYNHARPGSDASLAAVIAAAVPLAAG